MKVIADLHIHSRFSMATSKALNPSSLDRWAGIKGLDLLGAGDCTHPAWLRELRDNLEEAEEGLYTLKGGGPRFVLTGEISTIYKKGDKTRKVHHLVLLPDFSAAERLQAKLERVGNIRSDGRPILGLDSRDLLAVLMEADSRNILIPAHIWTPWFSVLGAKSGFDRVDECYGDLAGLIPAVETGLSSNPPMNWALSSLDRYGVISNSDAHSPEKLGREATIFEMDLSYPSLGDALWRRNGADILGTVEFFPQEGKYHYDGHRKCGVVVNPEDIADGLCPVCGKPLTMGVMRRVLALADRPVDEWAPCPPDFAGTNRRPYFSLIPLREILGELLNTGAGSKKVDLAYQALIDQAGSELRLLMDSPLPDIQNYRVPGAGGEALAEAVSRMRGGQVSVRPGYDGEYGVIRVFPAGDGAQSPLFDAGEGEPLRRAAAPQAPVSGREPGAPHAAPVPESAAPRAAAFSPDGAQQRAIAYEGPAALILAGPGTGKTAVLTARIKRLLERGVDPASILAVTFTNRAARELRDRAGGAVNAATFHSFCAAFLREEGPFPRDFAILGEAERDALLRDICNSAPGKITFRGLGDYIEERKRFLLLPGETLPALGPEQGDLVTIAQSLGLPEPIPERDALYGVYQERLAARRALDFDGLLARTVRLLADSPGVRAQTQGRFRFIFVDEYQDVNFAQYALLRLLTHPGTAPGGGQKLWVIGDPNQAIYGFRGSDKRLIDRFTADYPEAAQFYLGRSFRCASPIAAAAGALVDAPLEGAAGEVSLFRSEYPSDASEAEGIARRISTLIGGASFFAIDSGASESPAGSVDMDSIAILLRASGLAAPIAKALIDHGIPYKLSGEESWREEEEPDSVLASVQTGGVRIMTIHAAKGLEFDHVFVPALEEGILPFTLYGKGDRKKEHIEEEQRLLYVAMTRAQSGLYLSWARKRLFQGRLFQSPPSRFLGRLDRLIPLSETRRRARKQEKPSPQLDLF